MLSIVILAAGQGKRMYSDLPKVLHRLAGRTLLEHVYSAAAQLDHNGIHIVYGYGGRQVPDALGHLQANWVEQKQQLGTGHAVKLAISSILDNNNILILAGDVPLICSETLQALVMAASETGFSLLTSIVDAPGGYGRILRDNNGNVTRIVEEKDATPAQRGICEINTGIMVIRAGLLRTWLAGLQNSNAQGEYYLTDVIEKAVNEGIFINTVNPESVSEIRGINDRSQLAATEREYQRLQADYLMSQGVTLMDPARFDLRGNLKTGKDVLIDINVVIAGSVSIGNNVSIGPNCYISNTEIADGVNILPDCVIEDAMIGRDCRIGPFARIRPGTRLAEDVHIGNFVELKQAVIEAGSKAGHLSYIGDSEIGKNVNIGAGTITCNYDGANKHKTVIGDNVFVGSDTQLVAPVVVGDGVTIGAGTTVTRDIESGVLTYSKVEHKIVRDWQRPVKK